MRYLLDIIGLLFFASSFVSCTVAKGALHEISGLVMAVVGSVFIVGGVLLGAIEAAAKEIKNSSE